MNNVVYWKWAGSLLESVNKHYYSMHTSNANKQKVSIEHCHKRLAISMYQKIGTLYHSMQTMNNKKCWP